MWKDRIDDYRRKCHAIVGILKSKKISRVLKIAPEDEVRAAINSILDKRIRPSTEQHANVLRATADEIISKILSPPVLSITERGEEMLDSAFREAFWFHQQLSGLTATWGFKVRFLGIKLGIRPNVPIEDKTKQNRRNKSVEHRKLSETIREINKITNQNLNLRLVELADFRDSIIHCNPQGMKAYAVPLLGKDVLKNARGNVVMVALNGSSETKNLSDVKEENEIEAQDLFGWFLEIFNSPLPKRAFDLFAESIAAIDKLVLFAGISSQAPQKAVFENLMFRSILPSEQEVALYHQYFTTVMDSSGKTAKGFFNEIYKLLKSTK